MEIRQNIYMMKTGSGEEQRRRQREQKKYKTEKKQTRMKTWRQDKMKTE